MMLQLTMSCQNTTTVSDKSVYKIDDKSVYKIDDYLYVSSNHMSIETFTKSCLAFSKIGPIKKEFSLLARYHKFGILKPFYKILGRKVSICLASPLM